LIRFGLVKTSLVDYPGEVASVLFTHGCNLRCPFCHNPELVAGPVPPDFISEAEALAHLRKRRGVLGAAVISGGEPLLHPEIPAFIEAVRGLGLKVKLDTNGCFPAALEGLPADYIAMDVKTSLDRYDLVLGEARRAGETAAAVARSIAVVLASGLAHEFRTTAAPGLVSEEDIRSIARSIRGCRRWVLQRFVPRETLEPGWKSLPATSDETLARLAAAARSEGIEVVVRDGIRR